MNTLPNGCRVSKFTVYPKNWKSKSAPVNVKWYCRYRFYDAGGQCFQGYIADVNRLPTAAERREMMQAYIDQELAYLKAGYNPITKEMISPAGSSYKTWSESIAAVAKTLPLAQTTRRDFESRIGQVLRMAEITGIAKIHAADVKKAHIKQLLRDAFPDSAYGYNKARAYLMIAYKELVELDIIDTNIIKDISKQKVVRKIRETLTMDERQAIDRHLKENHYEFWRYLHIFFHSGCRSTELLQLKRCDVDLEGQRFKTLIKKGKLHRESWRTIKDIALPYWQDLLASPGEVVFSWGLKPGDKHLRFDTITKNWWKWVKKPLGITADFYSLKHLHTSEIVDAAGDAAAAGHNAHTSTAMVVGIYDTKRKEREHEKVKGIRNGFA